MAYDRQFRREALARRSLDWSVPDPRLYSEAFTGRVRSIPRCAVCLLDNHLTQDCPQNPDRPWWGWPPSGSPWSGPPASSSPAGPRHPSRYAGITMRVDVGCRHADISIPAQNAGETTLPSSAAGSASGTGPHLARRPPRRGETQYGHAANATNIVPIYYYI